MDRNKVSPHTLKRLSKMSPEKKATVEVAIARTQTPEFRSNVSAVRAILDREYNETGTIATRSNIVENSHIETFFLTLRSLRESRGLSLKDVESRSGIDRSYLSRLENGKLSNSSIKTLSRYAEALGMKFCMSMVDEPTDD